MNVADLMELLKEHDPLMRVVVADAVGIFGAQPEDLHVVDLSNVKALLIAPFEFVESWDATDGRAAMKPPNAQTETTSDAALLAMTRERLQRCHEAVEVDIDEL
jgi:uncharacterized protein involved in tellurium resistance